MTHLWYINIKYRIRTSSRCEAIPFPWWCPSGIQRWKLSIQKMTQNWIETSTFLRAWKAKMWGFWIYQHLVRLVEGVKELSMHYSNVLLIHIWEVLPEERRLVPRDSHPLTLSDDLWIYSNATFFHTNDILSALFLKQCHRERQHQPNWEHTCFLLPL